MTHIWIKCTISVALIAMCKLFCCMISELSVQVWMKCILNLHFYTSVKPGRRFCSLSPSKCDIQLVHLTSFWYSIANSGLFAINHCIMYTQLFFSNVLSTFEALGCYKYVFRGTLCKLFQKCIQTINLNKSLSTCFNFEVLLKYFFIFSMNIYIQLCDKIQDDL